MKDRIDRAKLTIRKHRSELMFGAGILVGVAGTFKLIDTVTGDLWLTASPEKLQRLIDEPSGAIKWDYTKRTVYLINEMNPDVK